MMMRRTTAPHLMTVARRTTPPSTCPSRRGGTVIVPTAAATRQFRALKASTCLSQWPFSSSRPFATQARKDNDDDDDNDNKKRGHKEDMKASTDGTTKPSKSSFFSSSSLSVLPGLGLSAAVATVGFTAASTLSMGLGVPLSGIPVSILLGMAIKNTVGLGNEKSSGDEKDKNMFQPGLTMASKTILQGGIVCVAAKLSVFDVIATSASSIPVVLGAVGAGMLFIPRAGAAAGLPLPMTLLLTAGTSICGVTAITALAPAIQAPPRDIAVAVANTVALGTVGMLMYPYVFHALCASSSEQAGMCLGVAIHDTSQVLGAALSYKEAFGDEVAFQIAAVTKLLRNLGLAVAIPALTYSYHQQQQREQQQAKDSSTANSKPQSTMSGLPTFTKYVPPFLYAFLGMSALRSFGDVYLLEYSSAALFENFTWTMDWMGQDVSKYALGTAMSAVGLGTSAASLRGVGWKPFAVGGAGALVVGGTGFAISCLMV